ncbi:MAG: SGNH/GDSL hydrolase family protein [Candidatus Omnitrophota bacterium]
MNKVDSEQKIVPSSSLSKWKRKILFNILFLVIMSIFILLCALEMTLRVYFQSRYNVPFLAKTRVRRYDPLLGWGGTKIMGDSQSDKKMKIFFIGDSFTAQYLDKKDMYYDVVSRKLGIELFVYGASGYGTLQEYLVIDKYIDNIRPDLVVLQTCSNDFINNDWDLERKSFIHNNHKVRPYYENGQIKYRFPRGPFFRGYIIPYSRLAYFISYHFDRILVELNNKGYLRTIEEYVQSEGDRLEGFKRSVDTTAELMGMIKKRCGRASLIAFPVFDDEPYFSHFKNIFRHYNINFLEEIPRLAWAAEGRKWERNDDHWTEKGQKVCGQYLTDYIKTNFLKNK